MRPAGRTKPGGVGDTPYDAPHHYAARDAARRPTTARARQRRSQGLEIERVNAQLAKRLASVKRAPASTFHAPDGEASLRPRAQRGPKGPRAPPPWDATPARRPTKTKASRGGSEGTEGANDEDDGENAAKRSWPPPKPTGGAQRMRAEARRIREANATLRKALEEQYKPNRDSQLVAEGKGRPVDGLEMWKRRLAIYDDEDGEKKGTKKASDRPKGGRTKVEKGVCTSTGVPKAMGVARCSATGLYTYYAADGHKLKEHPDCPGLYYCEWFDDFAAMDKVSQKQMIEHAKTGVWMPSRPANESWVVNRHMKLGLDMMRRMAKGDETVTMDSIREAVEEMKAREKMEDAERAKKQAELDRGAAEEAAANAAAASAEGGDAPVAPADDA